jgi:hypothetical protein
LPALEERRERLLTSTGPALRIPESDTTVPLTPERRRHLFEEAVELYWNDLEWENITEEERMEGGPLPELTFPGFLAYVRGLLLTQVRPIPWPRPRPGPRWWRTCWGSWPGACWTWRRRFARGPPSTATGAALEFRMTDGLLDRVLMTYHGIQAEDAGILDDG